MTIDVVKVHPVPIEAEDLSPQGKLWQRLSEYMVTLPFLPDQMVQDASANFSRKVWHSFPIDRGITDIARRHAMSVDDFAQLLKGKLVLDVGVGHSTLADDVEKLGITTSIISLDFPFVLRNTPGSNPKVAGDGQKLPIKTGGVDLILGTLSLPTWAHSADDINNFLEESKRVILRNGGQVKITPITRIATAEDTLAPPFELAMYREALNRFLLERLFALKDTLHFEIQLGVAAKVNGIAEENPLPTLATITRNGPLY